MFGLTTDDDRQLKLLGWFLLITNGIIVGMRLLFGRALEERPGALLLIVAVLVNGCFFLIVTGNIVAVALGPTYGRKLIRDADDLRRWIVTTPSRLDELMPPDFGMRLLDLEATVAGRLQQKGAQLKRRGRNRLSKLFDPA